MKKEDKRVFSAKLDWVLRAVKQDAICQLLYLADASFADPEDACKGHYDLLVKLIKDKWSEDSVIPDKKIVDTNRQKEVDFRWREGWNACIEQIRKNAGLTNKEQV